MSCSVNFLVRRERGLRAQGSPGVVAGEQGLEFTDDLLGCGFRDQVAFDLELERLLEEWGTRSIVTLMIAASSVVPR